TGTAAIIVDDRAQNCILVVPGANAGLSPEEVRQAAPALQHTDLLLCQLEVPLEATLEAFRLARAAGVRTGLTPAPAVALPEELLQLCDLCVPNETEVELLTGRATGSLAEAEAGAAELRRRGVRSVIVTLGERGALLVDGDGVTPVPAVPVK